MDQKMSMFKISEWVLIVDLLGASYRMAENIEWLNVTDELLDVIGASVYKSFNALQPSQSVKTYQYGDTINFFADDPQTLMLIAVTLQQDLFAKDQMAQMALACGGVYDLTELQFLQKLQSIHNGLTLQCLVGKAISKAHLLLRGVKGPRIIIDEEGDAPVNQSVWHRYIPHLRRSELDATGTDFKAQLPNIGFPRSEACWWYQVIEIDEQVQARITKLKNEITIRETENSNKDPIEERRINGLRKRKEHWDAFWDVLAHDK